MDPLLVVIALALIPIVYLFGFAGCSSFGSEPVEPDPPAPPPVPPPVPPPPDPKYQDIILAEPGLVSYWRLGETSGLIAVDSGPAAKNGKYEELQAITLGGPGALLARDPADKAPRFNGTAGRVDIPYHLQLNPPATLSFEAWIKPELTNPGNRAAAVGGLFDVDNASAVIRGFGLTVIYPSLELKAEIGLTKIDAAAVLPAGYPLRLSLGNDGNWKHVVLTVNVTASTVEATLYVNGTTSRSVLFDKSKFTYKQDFGSTPFRIGAGWAPQNPAAVPYYFFNGSLDEVALYNKVLTPAAVLKHFQASLPKA